MYFFKYRSDFSLEIVAHTKANPSLHKKNVRTSFITFA